jgi:putative MATE family efflux protein
MAEAPRELEKGDVMKHMFYLGIPLLIVNLMQNCFSIFEMFLLGKLGVQSLSAISIIGFIMGPFWSITGGLMAGAIAIISRYSGKKDYTTLKKAIVNTMFAAYALTAVYALLVYIFRNGILTFFGARGLTLELAGYILPVWLISILNDSGLYIFFNVLRGTGQIRRHFYLVVMSVVLNTVFEPLFIFGLAGFPKMGLIGAPLARLISYFITTVIMICILTRTSSMLKIEKKHLKLDPVFLWKFIKLSMPAALSGMISNVASLSLLKIASRGGDALLATMGIGSRLDNIVNMLCWAVGGSVTVMVGHNLGAGEVKRAEESAAAGLKIAAVFTTVCFLVYFIFSKWIIGIFSTDPAVINYGSWYLKIIGFFYILLGIGIMASNTLNGAGDMKTPMIINMIAYFVFQIPLAFLLYQIPAIGFRSIFIGIAAGFAFQGIAGWAAYKKGKWKSEVL